MAIDNPLAYMQQTGTMPNQFGIDTSGTQDGFLGGMLGEQKAQMGRHLYDQMDQGNQMDLASQALRLQQAKSDEAAYGQQTRDLKGAQANDELDLYKSGIMGEVHRGKAIADLSTSELQSINNHLQAQYAKLSLGESQAEIKDQMGGTINPAVLDQINDQRKQVGLKALPDDPGQAARQLDAERLQNRNSGPRLEATIKFMREQQLAREKMGNTASIEAGHDTARVQSAEIAAHAQKTMESMSTDILKRYNADPNSVNSREIAQVQGAILKTQSPIVLNSISTKMNELVHLDDPPEKQAKTRQKILLDNIPEYAQMENVRLERLAAEAGAKTKGIPKTAAQAASDTGTPDISKDTPPDPKASAKPPTGIPAHAIRKYGQDPKTGQYTWGWSF